MLKKNKHKVLIASLFLFVFCFPMLSVSAIEVEDNDYSGDYSVAGQYFQPKAALYRGSILPDTDFINDYSDDHLNVDFGATVIKSFTPSSSFVDVIDGQIVYRAEVKTLTPINVYTDYNPDELMRNLRAVNTEVNWLHTRSGTKAPYTIIQDANVRYNEYLFDEENGDSGVVPSRFQGQIDTILQFQLPEANLKSIELSGNEYSLANMEYVQSTSIINSIRVITPETDEDFRTVYTNNETQEIGIDVASTEDGNSLPEAAGPIVNLGLGVNNDALPYKHTYQLMVNRVPGRGTLISQGVVDNSNLANEMRFKLDVNLQPGITADKQTIVVNWGDLEIDTYKQSFSLEGFGLISSSVEQRTYPRDIGYTIENTGSQYIVESVGYIYAYVALNGITAEVALQDPEVFTGITFFDTGLSGDTGVTLVLNPGIDLLGIFDNILNIVITIAIIAAIVYIGYQIIKISLARSVKNKAKNKAKNVVKKNMKK